MATFKFTNKAIHDLSDIWNYTSENWSEKQADKYYHLLINYCVFLSKNPQQGKTYFDIQIGVFGIKASKHIIFYRIIDHSSIEITRILHERMDLKNQL